MVALILRGTTRGVLVVLLLLEFGTVTGPASFLATAEAFVIRVTSLREAILQLL